SYSLHLFCCARSHEKPKNCAIWPTIHIAPTSQIAISKERGSPAMFASKATLGTQGSTDALAFGRSHQPYSAVTGDPIPQHLPNGTGRIRICKSKNPARRHSSRATFVDRGKFLIVRGIRAECAIQRAAPVPRKSTNQAAGAAWPIFASWAFSQARMSRRCP